MTAWPKKIITHEHEKNAKQSYVSFQSDISDLQLPLDGELQEGGRL